MSFIGRAKEQNRLSSLVNSKGLTAALIYGRRRVGKSELILECLRRSDIRSLYYECRQTTAANNVKNLSEIISETFGLPPLAFNDIEDAFKFIFERAEHEKILLAIDEYPYLRDAVPGMDSILQTLLDTYRGRANLTLILCGSVIEVMKSLIDEGNPLYGRIDVKLNVQPMDYYDSSLFYPSFSPEDKVRLYSVFGGIPHYNRLVDEGQSVRDNIIRLVTEPDARLADEVPSHLLSVISKITNANEVFGALAEGYGRYKDILAQSHVSSTGMLANVLERLINMELVQKKAPINDPQNKKKTTYRICDGLSLFYYRYVFRYLSQRSVLDPETFYDRFVNDDFEHRYVPHAFEEVCRQYLVRMNRAGAINPPFNTIGSYWYDDPASKTNGEFGVVTEDPYGYVFYEAKFRATPVTTAMIEQEIEQVRRTGLNCFRYGFFSRTGFDVVASDRLVLIDLKDMYQLEA